MSQHSGSKNSEDSNGNRTPSSPGCDDKPEGGGGSGNPDERGDSSSISVDNIKEEKVASVPHPNSLDSLSNTRRSIDGKSKSKTIVRFHR